MEPSQLGLGRLHFDKKPVAILKVFAEGSGFSPQKKVGNLEIEGTISALPSGKLT